MQVETLHAQLATVEASAATLSTRLGKALSALDDAKSKSGVSAGSISSLKQRLAAVEDERDLMVRERDRIAAALSNAQSQLDKEVR